MVLLAMPFLDSCAARRPSAQEMVGGRFLTQECETLSNPEEAFAALLELESFRDTQVGEAGIVPAEVCAFMTVLKQDDVTKRFEQVLERGHVAGRLYALCGLYLTARPAFDAALPRFENLAEDVWTQYGCIIMKESVQDLLPRIRSGELPERFAELAKNARVGATQSNYGLSPTHSRVTPLANTTQAARRGARGLAVR